jgi:hypothetical protein
MPDFTTNAGNALQAAGTDFGTLIKGVGNAVASTQLQLTKTSVNSTSALASTIVDVIAVQETQYDDSGNISGSQSYTQKLPLIDFIDPVFYQWTNVRVQGLFYINEVSTAANATSNYFSSEDHSSQHGLLVIFGGGQTGNSFNSSDSSTSTKTDQAYAVGLMRMNAQLNPRTNIGVPKPTQVLQGPSINIVQGQLTELPGGNAPPTSKTLSLLLQLRRVDGTPIAGKALSVQTDGVPWSFSNSAQTVTDASGNLAIQLQRTFLTPAEGQPPPDTSAIPTVVTVRLGIVSNSVTVTF